MTRRTTSRRTFLGVIAGASGMTLLAACGGAAPTATTKPAAAPTKPAAQAAASTPAAAKPAAASGQKTTVKIHERANNIVEGGAQFELFKVHLEKWKAEHPNVDVVVEAFPANEYGPKILALHMGGQIGDMAYGAVGSGTFQYLAATDMVLALDEYVKRDNFDVNQYIPNMINFMRVSESGLGSGKLYGIPFLVHARDTVVFYNKKVLNAAGVQPPDGDKQSLDDFVQVAKSLTKKAADGRTQVYGWLPLSGYQYLHTICNIRTFGGELISEDGKKALYNSEQAKAAFKWLYDAQYTHGFRPAPSAGASTELFLSGQLAMITTAGNLAYSYAKGGGDFGVTPAPKGPTGVRGSMSMGDAYSIPANAKQKDLGWELIKWMTNKDAGVIMCGIGLCGARMDTYDDARVKALEHQPLFNRLVAEGMPFRGPANLRQVEVNEVTQQVTAPLWNGSAQPTDAFLNDVNGKIQAVLDKPRN